ncbi:hypothetical protein HG531_012659 [Fusarium graminearum]|nr:hypothetical protein HG531_012659 [Fusarium graminearum]
MSLLDTQSLSSSSDASPSTLSTTASSTTEASTAAAIPSRADPALDCGNIVVVHLHFVIFVVLAASVGELELASTAALGHVLALEGSDDELAVEVDLGLGACRLAHLDRLCGRDVGQSLLVEKIQGLIVVLDNCLIVLVLELALRWAILVIITLLSIVLALGSILLLLGTLLGLSDVDHQLLVVIGTVLVDVVVTKAADHALENVLYLGLEMALVLVAPNNKAALDDLSVVGGEEKVHGLNQKSTNGSDGSRNHVGCATGQTSANHGDELLNVGSSSRGVIRHVRNLTVVDSRAASLNHTLSHTNQKIVSCLTRTLVVLLARDNDLAEHGRNEVKRGVGDKGKKGDDCGETLSLHELSVGCDAEEGVDGLQDRTAALRKSLCVYVEQDGEHVAGKLGKVFEVLLGISAADPALKNKVLFLLLDISNSLVRLDKSLESSADVQSQLNLLVQKVCQDLRKALVERLGEIQRKVAVTGEDRPDLLNDCLVDLDFHCLLGLSVIDNPLEHEFTKGNHLTLEVSQICVACVIAKNREHPSTTWLTLYGLGKVQRKD